MAAYYVVDAKGNVTPFPVGLATADLSNLDASNLTSGTVPLARLAGITNAQIDAAAAIAYSKLALTGNIVNADIGAAAAIAWSKLSKSGSSLADLATRSAADLSSGSLAVARLGNGVTSTTTDTSTGTVNDWAPTLAGNTYIAWSGASNATFTGLSSSGITTGTIVFFKNTGSKIAFFSHLSGSSSAANQFVNIVTSGATPVGPGGVIAFLFNGTNWSLLLHHQGSWINVTYTSTDYTADTGAWTVDSGDVTTYKYFLIGNQAVFQCLFQTTTTTSTPTRIFALMPNGWTCSAIVSVPAQTLGGISPNEPAIIQVNSSISTSKIAFLRLSVVAWPTVTNTLAVSGSIPIPID